MFQNLGGAFSRLSQLHVSDQQLVLQELEMGHVWSGSSWLAPFFLAPVSHYDHVSLFGGTAAYVRGLTDVICAPTRWKNASLNIKEGVVAFALDAVFVYILDRRSQLQIYDSKTRSLISTYKVPVIQDLFMCRRGLFVLWATIFVLSGEVVSILNVSGVLLFQWKYLRYCPDARGIVATKDFVFLFSWDTLCRFTWQGEFCGKLHFGTLHYMGEDLMVIGNAVYLKTQSQSVQIHRLTL